jgi:hypothetical protein
MPVESLHIPQSKLRLHLNVEITSLIQLIGLILVRKTSLQKDAHFLAEHRVLADSMRSLLFDYASAPSFRHEVTTLRMCSLTISLTMSSIWNFGNIAQGHWVGQTGTTEQPTKAISEPTHERLGVSTLAVVSPEAPHVFIEFTGTIELSELINNRISPT